ncbi:hypothetical protein BB427_16160 [Pseudoalteromonas sp. BMB]|nr:hypothetical protein BB427_16160 [Pseudoalteromonas sp. BMB]
MVLFKLLSDVAPSKVFFSILSGCIGGLAYAIFVPLILLALEPSISRLMQPGFESSYWVFGVFEVTSPKQALFFVFICLVIIFCRVMSGTLMAQVAVDATVGLRKRFYERITQLPIQNLDHIGPSRLLTAMNNDIKEVTNGASAIPGLLIAMFTFLGLLGFLVYLKFEVFLFVMGVLLFGLAFYQIPTKLGRMYLVKARDSYDDIQEGMRGLVYGSKELKLNQQKRQDFLNESIHKSEDRFGADYKRGRMLLIFAMTWSNLMAFLAIGAVTYVMSNFYALSLEDTVAVVMVLLYITGPITAMTNIIPNILMAKVAAKKLDKLLNDMQIEHQTEVTKPIDCDTIHVKGVEYAYGGNKNTEDGFKLGTIDLSIHRGEVTFLVGGNGSGKTTLAKLLSLHYIPEKGAIHFDGHKVTADNRNACRQSISAIYSDFHLFSKLFGLSDQELDSRASAHLKSLGLDKKVAIRNGEFSTTNLSAGQKKRLALLVTYLEDRSIYVFDEWAADQDPEFKDIFYNQILPELKSRNKLVIVITHDDRYFHVADKLVKMESGKVINEDSSSTIKTIEHDKNTKETVDVN